MNASRLFTTAFALFLLAGCGNKGPLVLPTPPNDPATPEEAPAEDVDDTAPAEATEPVEDGTATPDEVPSDTPATGDGDGNG